MEFVLGFVLVWLILDKVFDGRDDCDCCEELEDDLDELTVDLYREIEDLKYQIDEMQGTIAKLIPKEDK